MNAPHLRCNLNEPLLRIDVFTYLSCPLLSIMPAFSECLACRICIALEKSLTAKPGHDETQPRIDTQKLLANEYTVGFSCMPEQKLKTSVLTRANGLLHARYSAVQFCNQIYGDSKLGHLQTSKHTRTKKRLPSV